VTKQAFIKEIKKSFDKNLSIIYKSKQERTTRLVTYQVANAKTAYMLQMIRERIDKVGTYAEALKKRFPKKKTQVCKSD